MADRGIAVGGRDGTASQATTRIGRRRLVGIGAAGLAALLAGTGGDDAARTALASEQSDERQRQGRPGRYSDGRLTARTGTTGEPGPTGTLPIGLGGDRDGLLFVPDTYRADMPSPLVVMLHGAGGDARRGLNPLFDLANEAGLILLAPESRGKTWDVAIGGYGPDVGFIDRALAQTFARYTIDPARVAIEGFSDGASYAISLGITNGDLFSSILAFSPGFSWPGDEVGKPRLFVSHGTRDDVLPIDMCSRRIVPKLRRVGFDVRYVEFDGGHFYPPEVVQDALAWFSDR